MVMFSQKAVKCKYSHVEGLVYGLRLKCLQYLKNYETTALQFECSLEWSTSGSQQFMQGCGEDDFILFYFLLFMYSCLHFSVTTFPTHPLPPPTLNPSPLWLCPWVLYTCSLMTLPLLSSSITLPTPLCLLSVCSLFQCLCLCFACFVCFVD